jgi:two-component system, response regulator PdtaR
MNILVVEDDAIIALSLVVILEEAGHTVVGPTRSADEALELSCSQHPILALIDINLDGEPAGIELARTLQRRGISSVFVSAQHAQAWANKDAAVGLIAKPYSAASVCRSLEALEPMLRGGAAPTSTGILELFPAVRSQPTR